MEQNENQQTGLFEMDLDYEARLNFIETAKWAKFLGIVAIVGLSILLLFFLFFGSRISGSFNNLFPGEFTGAGAMILVILLIVMTICGTLIYFILRASNSIRLGINTNNQETLNEGLNSLKIYFIIYGVLSILSTFSSFLKAF